MYDENEILETTEEIKHEGKVLPVKTKVQLVKVLNEHSLDNSMVAVKLIPSDSKYDLILKETMVRQRSWFKRRKAFRDFNEGLYRSNPRLRVYHYNPIKRLYFKAYYFIKGLKKLIITKIKENLDEEV